MRAVFPAETGEALALVKNALAAADLFGEWQPALMARVASTATLRRYERGDQIAVGSMARRQALLVVSGLIEVRQVTSSGRRFILQILGPGQVAGLPHLFREPPADSTYFVRERATLVHLLCEDYAAALDQDPKLWKGTARAVVDRHVDLMDSVFSQFVIGTPEVRIAATLRRLAQLYGVSAAEPAQIHLRMRLSQDDLADMLCVSRQTVNKALRQLETAGVIRSAYSAITILDTAALQRIVQAQV